MLEVMMGVVYMQVDILVNMDVDKVADIVIKIPIEGFTDVTGDWWLFWKDVIGGLGVDGH